MLSRLKVQVQKLKDNKSIILGHIAAAICGAVAIGIVGSISGELVGFNSLGAFLFGLLGQKKLAIVMGKRFK